MNKEQFARCPFCGKSETLTIGKASDAFSEPDECGDPMPYMHTESYAVTCNASKPDGPGGCGASGGYFPSEDEAIAAWNRRAEVERLTGLLRWAYSKLHHIHFNRLDDALKQDEIKLLLEHGE